MRMRHARAHIIFGQAAAHCYKSLQKDTNKCVIDESIIHKVKNNKVYSCLKLNKQIVPF